MTESRLERTCSEPDRYTTVGLDRGDRPSDVVVRTVATLTDQDPLDLDPLATVIDPEALDRLFARAPTPDAGTSDADAVPPGGPICRFSYEGCTVCVSPGVVRVRHADAP